MKPRIRRQSENYPAYWTPEDRELAAELQTRLQYKEQNGELPRYHPDSQESYTNALQEMIRMRQEREEYGDGPSGGDYSDFDNWADQMEGERQ